MSASFGFIKNEETLIVDPLWSSALLAWIYFYENRIFHHHLVIVWPWAGTSTANLLNAFY